jgi:CRISPR system Cascade subunit CasE
MFLSQLLVNTAGHPDQPRPGREWIKQTYRVHQRIWMAFPNEERRRNDPFFLGTWSSEKGPKPRRDEAGFLFRIEPDLPTRVLVQSVLRPDWDYAFQNAPYLLAAPPLVREFSPTPQVGQSYRFRLIMLMVKRRTRREGEGKARSEHPIRCLLPPVKPGDRPRLDPAFTAWRERLTAAGSRHGFELGEYPQRLSVQPAPHLKMKPGGDGPADAFNAALFEGELVCTDTTRLTEAVINGIGRGRAFGMGLLSLAASP